MTDIESRQTRELKERDHLLSLVAEYESRYNEAKWLLRRINKVYTKYREALHKVAEDPEYKDHIREYIKHSRELNALLEQTGEYQ